RACRLHTPTLVRAARHLLEHELRLRAYALGLHLLSLPAMIALNRRWLHHAGPTDVITFDHHTDVPALELYGEVFLCPLQARRQARQFHVDWTRELARHLVHGVLHLQGFDDLKPHLRAQMKRRENLLLRRLGQAIDLRQISGEPSPKS
ncbi:MAG: rRNA maturation RNase YbeY, partial [Verrucomicrobia bacterium]|nr:rRNA maturation RNase YbeY [Verrucomicrobiota bacterium]